MTVTTANHSAERRNESGMTLIAVMAMMAIFAIAMLAVAPSVQQEVQREKELESIRRGEEIAEAIKLYVIQNRGKLPESIDDLLEGISQGTKKRMILRASAATDPLSPDGKWRLVKAEPNIIAAFAKRVQTYNNGVLPDSPPLEHFNKYAMMAANIRNTGTEDETENVEEDFEVVTDNQPFIGVASQSRAKSLISYYGIERHSNWIFTPLYRGSGATVVTTKYQQQQIDQLNPPPPPRTPRP